MATTKERDMEYGKDHLAMKTPPIVSQQEWEAARQQLLVKEKALMHARDAMAAERRRMPWMAVEKKYEFDGPNGKVSLLDLFEGRQQLIVYRAFFEPGVFGWPDHACRGCSLGADQVSNLAHLNARDTTLAWASRAPQADIARLKARMGWEMPWYTMTDSFDVDFGVDQWHGHNAFIRDGDKVFRTYLINSRGDEAMGTTWSYLDMTALGRQETWEDSPRATRRLRRISGGTGTTTTTPRPRLIRFGSISRPTLLEPPSDGARQKRKHVTAGERLGAAPAWPHGAAPEIYTRGLQSNAMAFESANLEENQAFERLAEPFRREIKIALLPHAWLSARSRRPCAGDLSACLAQFLQLRGLELR